MKMWLIVVNYGNSEFNYNYKSWIVWQSFALISIKSKMSREKTCWVISTLTTYTNEVVGFSKVPFENPWYRERCSLFRGKVEQLILIRPHEREDVRQGKRRAASGPSALIRSMLYRGGGSGERQSAEWICQRGKLAVCRKQGLEERMTHLSFPVSFLKTMSQ